MRILKLSSPRSTHEQRVPHPLIFKGAGLFLSSLWAEDLHFVYKLA